ncbi:H-NS histone family protein [Paraburkholderia sp. BR14320]|uniref:H-NS histone family protein n=1 Tax=unclassified Paraburkholderia TaxID=2615204 RepID=UPI0034D00ED9
MSKKRTMESQIEQLNAKIAAEHAKFKTTVAGYVAEVLAEYGLTLVELALADHQTPDLLKGAAPVTRGARKRPAAPAEPNPKRKRRIVQRGGVPPKYRDRASGATWSGRGRAPAWIAGAQDRTKFLINGGA